MLSDIIYESMKHANLNINRLILLELLNGQIIRGSAVKHTRLAQNRNRLNPGPLLQPGLEITYLLVKRKSSKALANSGHIESNFPDEACWRATGNPIDSTFSREETASFQVLSDGQAYFKPKGILRV